MASRNKQIQGSTNPILTTFATGFKPVEGIARMVAPIVPSLTESGTIFTFGKEGMQLFNTTRAARSNAQKMDWEASTDTYRCVEHALETSLDKIQEIQQAERYGAEQVLRLKQRATNIVQSSLETEMEKAVADYILDATYYASGNKVTLSGGDKWSDKSNSDPIGQLETGRAAARDDMGRDPNTLVLGYDAYRELKNHPAILELIKYSQKAVVTAELLASLLDFDRVLVGKGVYATDAGLFTDIWPDNAALIYTPPAMDMVEGSTPHTIVIEEMGYPQVSEYDQKKTIDIEVTRKYVVKNISTSYGYLIVDCK